MKKIKNFVIFLVGDQMLFGRTNPSHSVAALLISQNQEMRPDMLRLILHCSIPVFLIVKTLNFLARKQM